jgi:hypothetical protein
LFVLLFLAGVGSFYGKLQAVDVSELGTVAVATTCDLLLIVFVVGGCEKMTEN